MDWFDLSSTKPAAGRMAPEAPTNVEMEAIIAKAKAGKELDFNEAEKKWLDGRIKEERFLHLVPVKKTAVGNTFGKTKKVDMGVLLTDFLGGKHPVDWAIRPMAVAGDEASIFFQISFFHGSLNMKCPAKATRMDGLWTGGISSLQTISAKEVGKTPKSTTTTTAQAMVSARKELERRSSRRRPYPGHRRSKHLPCLASPEMDWLT